MCVVPVGGELAAHRHAVTESYFFLEGTGSQRLGDEVFDVQAGSAVMIGSDTVHATRNTGDRPLRFFYVFATGSFDDVHYAFD
ncbi:cupin domain-containing protein [Nocardioides aequoreus]|uniref:cupin domain-containing protein n=1 Tax=Nocardioides aequoreus TaxID=397278 RepID=UPI00248163D2|nr:cupin domain-containing protein [Nocardioides aequoreus]